MIMCSKCHARPAVVTRIGPAGSIAELCIKCATKRRPPDRPSVGRKT